MQNAKGMPALKVNQTARKMEDDGASAPSVIKEESITPRLLGLKSAAGYLSLSYWTVRELIWRGEIPSVRVGRRILVDREDLDAFIERNKLVESI